MSPRRNCAAASPASAANSRALAREGEIPRTHAPVHIDRADDAVGFPDAVPSGFVEPSHSLVGIGRNLEAAGKQRLRILLRELGVARRRRLAPLCDSSAQRAVQEDESEAELRHGVAALGRLPVPLHRLGEIALNPLAFDVKLRDPERRLARTGRPGGAPAPERGDEALSGIGRFAAVHEARGARASDRRTRRETGCENGVRSWLAHRLPDAVNDSPDEIGAERPRPDLHVADQGHARNESERARDVDQLDRRDRHPHPVIGGRRRRHCHRW